MKKYLSLLLLVVCAFWAGAKSYTPADVPNVHLSDSNKFVSDPDSLLSASARAQADSRLRALMDSTGAEVAIVVLPEIDKDIFDFTHELASSWGVGKSDNSNGLVILFDIGGRQVRIHTGKGLEGVLPDAACNRIINEVIVPCMRTGDLDDAVVDTSDTVFNILTDPEAAAEIRSDNENDAIDTSSLLRVMWMLACLVGAGLYAWIIFRLFRLRGKDDFEKTRILRAAMPTVWIFTVLSALLGLPGALLMLWLAHHYRNRPRRCDVCGTIMKKLPEDEDNRYLSPAQDLEENLKSVDYDVWLCPKCGATDVFPFEQQSSYRPCPHCHARAYSMLYDRVEVQPTTMRQGRGVKVYGCKNCGFRNGQPYTIARLAAGVIIGGGSGGRGGGGGMSGGSWGGGSFGGGGASGSW